MISSPASAASFGASRPTPLHGLKILDLSSRGGDLIPHDLSEVDVHCSQLADIATQEFGASASREVSPVENATDGVGTHEHQAAAEQHQVKLARQVLDDLYLNIALSRH